MSAQTTQRRLNLHISIIKAKMEKGHSWEKGLFNKLQNISVIPGEGGGDEASPRYRECLRLISNQPGDLLGGSHFGFFKGVMVGLKRANPKHSFRD